MESMTKAKLTGITDYGAWMAPYLQAQLAMSRERRYSTDLASVPTSQVRRRSRMCRSLSNSRPKTWCAHCTKTFLVALLLTITVGSLSSQDFTTERSDNDRTGTSFNTGLNQAAFGQNRRWGRIDPPLTVQGNVYAQPLFLGQVQVARSRTRDIVLVATALDNVYSFDAASHSQLWARNLGQNDVSITAHGCDALSPQGIGIEATPVIDRAQSAIFVSYRTNQGTNPNLANPDHAHQWIESLDFRTGTTDPQDGDHGARLRRQMGAQSR